MSDTVIMVRLKELRAKRGVSQEVAAEGCGISRIALARYENGTRVPTAENTKKLADYYGVTVDYLMGRDPPPEQEQPKITVSFRSDVGDLWNKLSPQNQDLILEIGRRLFEVQDKVDKKKPT